MSNVIICKLCLAVLAQVSPVQTDVYMKAYQAVQRGDTVNLQLALRQGVEVDHRYRDEESLLMQAANDGHTSIMRVLLQAGAKPESTDLFGEDALGCAIAGGHLKAVRLLLKYGVSANGKKPDSSPFGRWRPMHLAADFKSIPILTLLLHAQADINGKTWLAMTPLDIAEKARNPKIVKFLRAHGAMRSKEMMKSRGRSA